MNILDYLSWRNDVPFTISKFNEVDSLILSELAYIDYEKIVQSSSISLQDVNDEFFLHHNREEIEEEATFTKRAPLLFKDMLLGGRFSSMKLSHYINEIEEETNKQFSAITFLFDHFIFIAFRGTDQSVVGWKEDFLLSSMSDTESQKAAVSYINRVGHYYSDKDILVGGHSKGGHLAVYGATYCDQDIKKRIKNVYSHDGPGFRHEVLQSKEYEELKSRIIHIVPDMAAVGLMLSYEKEAIVIKSDALGLFQHDAFTWQTESHQFQRASLSKLSTLFSIGLGSWLEDIDDNTRKEVVNTTFSLIEATGHKTIGDFKEKKLKSLSMIIMESKKLPASKRKELLTCMSELIKSESQAFKDAMTIR
ncbi:Mbeg1-like protein [Kandleria vitulina]|uniref:Mbeg1-like protein n=1 Tax=Kandleria vitulina TaxID=1630 RepID=UPI00048C8496|nr:Mbeg1-like protein [Kandleria vitulina]